MKTGCELRNHNIWNSRPFTRHQEESGRNDTIMRYKKREQSKIKGKNQNTARANNGRNKGRQRQLKGGEMEE